MPLCLDDYSKTKTIVLTLFGLKLAAFAAFAAPARKGSIKPHKMEHKFYYMKHFAENIPCAWLQFPCLVCGKWFERQTAKQTYLLIFARCFCSNGQSKFQFKSRFASSARFWKSFKHQLRVFYINLALRMFFIGFASVFIVSRLQNQNHIDSEEDTLTWHTSIHLNCFLLLPFIAHCSELFMWFIQLKEMHLKLCKCGFLLSWKSLSVSFVWFEKVSSLWLCRL